MNRMVRVLLASSALLSICGCEGGGGEGAQTGNPPPVGQPPPAQPPPPQPDATGTVDVTIVDVFGAPSGGALISLHSNIYSNSGFQQAFADTDGRATFTTIQPGVVVATAYAFDQSFGYGIGHSSEAELPPNGHANLPVIVRPAADPVIGSTIATVDPSGLSTDGRSLTFRFNLTYVDGSRRIDYDAQMPLQSLEVSLAECVPDGGNDSPVFKSDCVGGTSGFDAAYGVDEPPAPFVFHTSMAAGRPQPYSAALLLDQSKHIQLYDPGDARLFGTKYFLLQNRVTDHVVLAAFGADDASIGEFSPLPQQPVTIFPVQNGTSSFSTVDSLAHLEGGVEPLYAAIDQMLDFVAANETAVGQRRMVVVVTDGRDDTCGTEAECRDARQAVAEKSLATGIEIVTIGLGGGAFEDRRALSELTAASQGRSFWVSDPTQLGVLFGALPEVLSHGGQVGEVSFGVQASTAGVFRSGRTVFGTVLGEECPFDCSYWSIPIAVRIP
jgi:hypothetical protein